MSSDGRHAPEGHSSSLSPTFASSPVLRSPNTPDEDGAFSLRRRAGGNVSPLMPPVSAERLMAPSSVPSQNTRPLERAVKKFRERERSVPSTFTQPNDSRAGFALFGNTMRALSQGVSSAKEAGTWLRSASAGGSQPKGEINSSDLMPPIKLKSQDSLATIGDGNRDPTRKSVFEEERIEPEDTIRVIQSGNILLERAAVYENDGGIMMPSDSLTSFTTNHSTFQAHVEDYDDDDEELLIQRNSSQPQRKVRAMSLAESESSSIAAFASDGIPPRRGSTTTSTMPLSPPSGNFNGVHNKGRDSLSSGSAARISRKPGTNSGTGTESAPRPPSPPQVVERRGSEYVTRDVGKSISFSVDSPVFNSSASHAQSHPSKRPHSSASLAPRPVGAHDAHRLPRPTSHPHPHPHLHPSTASMPNLAPSSGPTSSNPTALLSATSASNALAELASSLRWSQKFPEGKHMTRARSSRVLSTGPMGVGLRRESVMTGLNSSVISFKGSKRDFNSNQTLPTLGYGFEQSPSSSHFKSNKAYSSGSLAETRNGLRFLSKKRAEFDDDGDSQILLMNSQTPSGFPGQGAGSDPDEAPPRKARWNAFKWTLFISVLSLFSYGLLGLIGALLTWARTWTRADVSVVADSDILIFLTLASFLCVFTSVVGLCGAMLNSRPILALYAFLLWPTLASMLVVGYTSYKRENLRLDRKLNMAWSRYYDDLDRLRLQNNLHCCGYYSPLHEATFSRNCYPRTSLPGCKGKLYRYEKEALRRLYSCVFGFVFLHLANIVIALLCSNHVNETFGKGLTPRAYRLDITHVRRNALDIMKILAETASANKALEREKEREKYESINQPAMEDVGWEIKRKQHDDSFDEDEKDGTRFSEDVRQGRYRGSLDEVDLGQTPKMEALPYEVEERRCHPLDPRSSAPGIVKRTGTSPYLEVDHSQLPHVSYYQNPAHYPSHPHEPPPVPPRSPRRIFDELQRDGRDVSEFNGGIRLIHQPTNRTDGNVNEQDVRGLGLTISMSENNARTLREGHLAQYV